MTENRLIVFNYHRVHTNDKSINTMFDEGVYTASASQFKQQMIWLKNNTEVISEDMLLNIIRQGKPFSKPSSLITFDDGYVDNYQLAYPILKELEIPAIYFIPTGQISSRKLGWWDIIAYLVKKSHKLSIRMNNIDIPITNASNATKFLQRRMMHEPYENTKDMLRQLSEACGVSMPSRDIQDKELMTWDQIREASLNGITIGSHTHSHRVLTTISEEAQKEEMFVSKSILEREIGIKVHSIAYPVGGYKHFSERSQILSSECGYELGFSFNTGVNYSNNIIPSNIKRIEPHVEFELFTSKAMLPEFITSRM